MKKRGCKFFFLPFLLSVLLLSSLSAGAQVKKDLYNVRLNNLTLKEALVKITSQCGYYFVYEDADVANVPKINKEFKSSTIEQIITECLSGTGLTFTVGNKTIYIRKAAAKNPNNQKAVGNGEPVYVTGKITDVGNEPLPGAYVRIKEESGSGVSTDAEGNYKIKLGNVSNDKILVVTYLGMKQQDIAVNGRDMVNVVMQEEKNELEQIVVVGYGSVKKKDIAGSIQNVTSSEIAKSNTAAFEKAIEGKVSGVQITSTSGIPGSSFSINIRGRGSINADTQPLYIVDGVQIANGSQTTNVITNANAMGGINPDDIESISVLKDGASASIYGAQAANGVVIITTKKGAAGSTKVSFNATVGIQQIARKVPVMNGKQWAEFALLEYKNYDDYYGTNNYLTQLDLFKSFGWGDDGYSKAPTTDWYKEIFRTAKVSNYEVNVSGGTDKTKFYVSGNYNVTDGIIKHTDYDRATGRVNLTHEITPWLTLNTNNTFSKNNYNQAPTAGAYNPARTAMFLLPGVSPRNSDGSYLTDLAYGYYLYNIPQMMELNEYSGKSSNLLSANDLTFKIIKGLEFKSSYNFDMTWMQEHQYSDPRTRLGARVNGQVSAYSTDINKFQTEQVLTYNATILGNRFNAVAGFSYIDYKYHMTGSTANGVSNPELKLLSSASTPILAAESYSEWKMAGCFARLGYTIKDKYIFNATVRYDGSSRFGSDNKWGWFPSISFAWRMKEEDFMKNADWISDLKLRASYGVTGNANIGDYVASRLYEGGYAYNGIAGIVSTSIGNQKLSWEKKHSKNVGLTAGFLKDKINIDLDVYRDDTKDLLYYRTIPQTTGYSQIPFNMGGVKNVGLDIQINTVNFETDNLKWQTSLNLSFCKNSITKLQDGLDQIGNYKVGKPVTAEYVYKWAGVNASDGRPMYYDKDGYITYNPTLADRSWTKGADPTFFGGLENTVSWKNLTLTFFFQFQRGAVKYWSDKTVLIGQAADNNLLKDVYYKYWKQPGDVTWVPKPVYNGTYPGNPMKYDNNGDTGMSLIYESTDFIKLKDVTLSYNVPDKLVKKLKLTSAQFFLNAYNLWTTTPYQGYDPESVGNDRGIYPQSKSYSIGVKINF
ncbi:MAG TPA: TonB-dependent receptor [Candidatus Egerieousia sp.]|nr:TonB-dependent receptor [Candidatus Egerieousia sp.]HPT06356.1 TonB-dependent receptor [Candidatus Egerieousia sp.]